MAQAIEGGSGRVLGRGKNEQHGVPFAIVAVTPSPVNDDVVRSFHKRRRSASRSARIMLVENQPERGIR
jgi:hypothetical protein